MIKVLIVEDSTFIRKALRQMLSYDPEIEVIDEAGDGREAIEKTVLLKPDVITMDIIMPGVDGIWALEEIMKQRPTPIVILSSIGISMSDIVQEAFSLGVVDVIAKPSSPHNLTIIRKELIEKIKAASHINRFRLLEHKSMSVAKRRFPRHLKTHQIAVIVTSAGGPPSLYEVVSKFSDHFYAGVVVAQHIPSNFVPSFVHHIQKMTYMPVKVASKGDILYSRRVLFSPTNATLQLHQTKKGAVVDLVDFKTRLQPDIDKVISSCAHVFKSGTVLVVLSGLGNDGVKGAEEVKRFGGKVIIEDKSTAGIYSGMPSSVVKSGFYDVTCPSYSIAETVESYFGKKSDEITHKKKFLVKGIVLKSTLGYLRTSCTPDTYSDILSALSENTRSVLNSSLNSYNYYPGDLYNELFETIYKQCSKNDPDILGNISKINAQDCLKVYKQGFPTTNIEHFINFLPTFQKVVFPGSTWELVELRVDSKQIRFVERSEGYTENNSKMLAKASNGWITFLFQTVGADVTECINEVGEDDNGWYILCKLKWK